MESDDLRLKFHVFKTKRTVTHPKSVCTGNNEQIMGSPSLSMV